MGKNKGILFVIEGTDGSGKETQSNILKERLEKEGIDFKSAKFPRYEKDSSSLVKMYLGGEFGTDPKAISSYVASTFYAADRYAAFKTEFEEYYNKGGILIFDRYTTANMVHQAGKIDNLEEREKFLTWLEDFEFNMYGLPRPTKVIFLNMPVETSLELTKNRENKIDGSTKKDIHESDKNHLTDAHNAACYVSKKYNWAEINCAPEGKLRTIENISDEIYSIVKKYI